MSSPRPASIVAEAPDTKHSFIRNVSAKASQYHARVPYLQKLPFPVIAVIVTLIVVNLLVWTAVGIVLVCFKIRCMNQVS